jgi:hypothetical protein
MTRMVMDLSFFFRLIQSPTEIVDEMPIRTISWDMVMRSALPVEWKRIIPKGMDFSEVTNKQIKWIEINLNNRPRKRLGYLTPNEEFKQIINQNLVAFAS